MHVRTIFTRHDEPTHDGPDSQRGRRRPAARQRRRRDDGRREAAAAARRLAASRALARRARARRRADRSRSRVGDVFYALTSERGTRYVWQAATSLLGGRLTGTLDGGAIATGVRLRNVHWKSLDGKGTDIAVDSVSGRWALTREPLRFTIDYLHIGTIDARIAPSNERHHEDGTAEGPAHADPARDPRS